MNELQRELRRLRKQRGLTQAQVAEVVGYVPSAASNWETGRTTPDRATIAELDTFFGARGGLIRILEEVTQTDGVAPWLSDDKQLSERAVTIEVVTPVLVPALLESPLYARYALAEGRPSDPMSRIEALARDRCAHLGSLSADVRVFATFPESGLQGVSRAVRKEQATHLLGLIESDRVRVHMVPVGSILAGVTSPFQIYKLRDGSRVATSEHTNGTIVVNEAPGVQRLQELARNALGSALPVDDTLRRLKEISDE
ncbi:Scr1 family TA system antitoxin-like transcriptional regulator [Nocardiopsis tropica]|uniref:Scr1 family TA system antitoxin-like transcriptional regulator n=1 Tax=Nocardiopsis tropica TaxID=109330 RepID=A0ABU7KIZ7_9ACTN|nr:Scr1 family TA system antitoxin-like transcriptional regulator [Nocardiopsis umidischolae]MEE2049263.1 Scr1 family TA system antitoxin-like transcriptional regulator [Nocardiopsis umidischolae]